LQNSAVLVNCNLANDEDLVHLIVLAEKFVLEEKGQVVTTRIDGSDSQTISIFCCNVKLLVKIQFPYPRSLYPLYTFQGVRIFLGLILLLFIPIR